MNSLKIQIPQDYKYVEISQEYINAKPQEIIQSIMRNLFPQNSVPTNQTMLLYKDQELDKYKTLREQRISPNQELKFYYSQQLKINCVCENQNFILEVESFKKIGDYMYDFRRKFLNLYKNYQINVFYKSVPYKLDTPWFVIGINNMSRVEIQILLPIKFIYCKQGFEELIPSTWKVHKIITYITRKKQIDEIVQFNSQYKQFDNDLELNKMFDFLDVDWYIDIVQDPQYRIQLNDGKYKTITINSKKRVIDLCDAIIKEFNISKTQMLELQYGQMKLNNQARIMDEMILNNSTILITNQNLKFVDPDQDVGISKFTDKFSNNIVDETIQQKNIKIDNKKNELSNDNLQIILINKKNPYQIIEDTFKTQTELSQFDSLIIDSNFREKFIVEYFQKENQIKSNSNLASLEKDQQNKITIYFLIQKKKSILKSFSSSDESYAFKFSHFNSVYTEIVSMKKSLKLIEEEIKKKYQINEDYTLFQNDQIDQTKTIFNLGLSSLNILFEFKKKQTKNAIFQINLLPHYKKYQLSTSQLKTVSQLREYIKATFLKDNNTARIQIKIKQKIPLDDEDLNYLIQENNSESFDVSIFYQFRILFQGPNLERISDYVYEDWLIKDSVICLGLYGNQFSIESLSINIEQQFSYYSINQDSQVILYEKVDSKKYNQYQSSSQQSKYNEAPSKYGKLQTRSDTTDRRNPQQNKISTNNQEIYYLNNQRQLDIQQFNRNIYNTNKQYQ